MRPVTLAWVNLTNGGMSGGYEKYLQAVLPRLTHNPRFRSITVYSPDALMNSVPVAGVRHVSRPDNDWLLGYPRLRAALANERPDVVFVPTARWVNTGDIPSVVMLRNMEPLVSPLGQNGVIDTIRNIARRLSAKRACLRADRVIAVSDYVSSYLLGRWHLPPHHVTRIYHGLDWSDSPITLPPALELMQSPFLLAAGSIRPLRGFEDILAGMTQLSSEYEQLRLVIAGGLEGNAHGYARHLRNLCRELGIDHRVVWAGPLKRPELAWCYQHAAAFLMTSRVEACPNTALEAMQHGCPIVSSTSAPMPEFFEDAALYYRAGDSAQLAQTVARLLANGPLRAKLEEAARRRASMFDWDTTSAKTAACLIEASQERMIA